jgi:DNA-binding CsgD family transcriptional regulator
VAGQQEQQAAQASPSGAKSARDDLEQGLSRGPGGDLAAWLQNVTEQIPLAIGSDFANLRVLSTSGALHLVGASGCNAIEIRKRTFTPLELEPARRLLENGGHVELARSLGIPWTHVTWAVSGDQLLGTIAVGCRTRRRPGEDDLRYLDELAARLGERLTGIDRSDAVLRSCAMSLAQAHRPVEWPSDEEPVARLRPRERAILELYADGLGTQEIADLLVISRHTIRTHVRNALRTLDVHTRGEAATIVRADQLAQLL